MSDETAFLEKATTPAGNNPLEEKAASAGEVSTVDPLTISNIVEKHGTGRGGLISILQDIQIRYGYLPADALRIVATRTERSLVDIYGVATFYRWFSLKPRGKHVVSCCLGTACHVRGAPKVAAELQAQLKIKPGETTPDREFTLETVNCLGACALGPIVVGDGHYFPSVSTGKVKAILDKVAQGLNNIQVEEDERVFPVDVSCPRCNHSFMDPDVKLDGYPSIRITVACGNHHGSLRLSSLYGSPHVASAVEVPVNEVADFFCPHCHTHLTGASGCPECDALMIPMIVKQGGVVQVCPRRGCKGHRLDLS